MKYTPLFVLPVLIVALKANANTNTTFNFTWSGTQYGNSAHATGFITMDTGALNPSPGRQTIYLPDARILDLEITITGASTGNGTFTKTNFYYVDWDTGGVALDLSKELIGQPTSTTYPWGPTITLIGGGPAWVLNHGGSFNFAPFSGPGGTDWFTLTTSSGTGDRMLLTSMIATQTPTLSIRSHPNQSILLSWPLSASGLVLQQNTNLYAGTGWQTNSSPVIDTTTEHTVTIPCAGTMFFRLK